MTSATSSSASAVKELPTDPNLDDIPDERLEMAQEDIDAIIRNKRKARDPKACYACHRRKVKCDRNLPCDSCVKRDHPELCSYERPGKRRRVALVTPVANQEPGGQSSPSEPLPTQTGSNVMVPKQQWDRLTRELQTLKQGANVTVPKDQWQRMTQELQTLRETVGQTRRDSSDGPLDKEEDDDSEDQQNRSDEREREGIHAPSDQMGTMHLGSRSVLAYMVALGRSKSSQDAATTLLEENILPKLGLDNETATYPFVDLWSTDSTMQDVSGLCKALPDDDLCHEFFVAYRDVACTIYPVIADAQLFEATLSLMLHNRARSGGDFQNLDPDRPYGVSMNWLALLFAVLASGAQSTNRPAKERELTSQVYICCSYQALRMANFLTHPSLEAIQAFLIIGNVLSYNMNPGVAYIFLGLTMRMAFSIGLQTDSQSFPPAEQYLRGRIWWALAWQDSHFSVSYDRPTASALCTPEIPYRRASTPGHRSYAESMFRIIRLTQEIIRERTLNPRTTMTWTTIQSYKEEVARIVADGSIHLRERAYCHITTQHLERLALKLHSSYITSELCRPALKESPTANHNSVSSASGEPNSYSGNPTPVHSPSTASLPHRRKSVPSHSPNSTSSGTTMTESHLTAQLRHDCIKNLERTVDAYLELHYLSQFAARSWIGIQRAVSAAFLLGTLRETNQDPRIHKLLLDLEHVITQRTVEDPAFEPAANLLDVDSPELRSRSLSVSAAGGEKPPLAESPHWAKSMVKSLNALGKMNKALAGTGTSHFRAQQQLQQLQAQAQQLQYHGQGQGHGYNYSQGQGQGYNHGQVLPGHSYPNSNSNSNSNSNAGMQGSGPMYGVQATGIKGGGGGSMMSSAGTSAPGSSGGMPAPSHGSTGHIKTENFSPRCAGGTAPLSAITPDSSSGSDWNYGNMSERAREFVQPALWG